MTGGKVDTAGLAALSGVCVVNGEPLDKRLRGENELLRDVLRMAVAALRFDDSLCARGTLRRMAERLNGGGLASFVAELRALPPADSHGGGSDEHPHSSR